MKRQAFSRVNGSNHFVSWNNAIDWNSCWCRHCVLLELDAFGVLHDLRQFRRECRKVLCRENRSENQWKCNQFSKCIRIAAKQAGKSPPSHLGQANFLDIFGIIRESNTDKRRMQRRHIRLAHVIDDGDQLIVVQNAAVRQQHFEQRVQVRFQQVDLEKLPIE